MTWRIYPDSVYLTRRLNYVGGTIGKFTIALPPASANTSPTNSSSSFPSFVNEEEDFDTYLLTSLRKLYRKHDLMEKGVTLEAK
jgi:hypothetical protein